MAHNVEPMDIDNIESDFDNKENSIHHSNVYPRTPCTEKGYEELDVSELNMKLRYSITPAASPMSKSYTANYADSRILESGDDTLNANLTRSLHSAFSKSDVNKSVKMMPLQTISSDQLVENNRNTSVLRPLDTTVVFDTDVTVTVTEAHGINENVSFPSSSSSMAQTPEATTPTKDIPHSDGGSPIMRGLKSVLNMFRSSQSPIPPVDGGDGLTKQVLSPAEVPISGAESSSALSEVSASTPIAAHKHKESSLSKRNSPLKESIVFNEDLEKELLWKDETTILFSQEKIPIHKLFFQQAPSKETVKNETEKPDIEDNLNSTVEYMDISYNDSIIKNKTITELQHEGLNLNESDSEFVDCETTFTNDKSVVVEKKQHETDNESISIIASGVDPTNIGSKTTFTSDQLDVAEEKQHETDNKSISIIAGEVAPTNIGSKTTFTNDNSYVADPIQCNTDRKTTSLIATEVVATANILDSVGPSTVCLDIITDNGNVELPQPKTNETPNNDADNEIENKLLTNTDVSDNSAKENKNISNQYSDNEIDRVTLAVNNVVLDNTLDTRNMLINSSQNLTYDKTYETGLSKDLDVIDSGMVPTSSTENISKPDIFNANDITIADEKPIGSLLSDASLTFTAEIEEPFPVKEPAIILPAVLLCANNIASTADIKEDVTVEAPASIDLCSTSTTVDNKVEDGTFAKEVEGDPIASNDISNNTIAFTIEETSFPKKPANDQISSKHSNTFTFTSEVEIYKPTPSSSTDTDDIPENVPLPDEADTENVKLLSPISYKEELPIESAINSTTLSESSNLYCLEDMPIKKLLEAKLDDENNEMNYPIRESDSGSPIDIEYKLKHVGMQDTNQPENTSLNDNYTTVEAFNTNETLSQEEAMDINKSITGITDVQKDSFVTGNIQPTLVNSVLNVEDEKTEVQTMPIHDINTNVTCNELTQIDKNTGTETNQNELAISSAIVQASQTVLEPKTSQNEIITNTTDVVVEQDSKNYKDQIQSGILGKTALIIDMETKTPIPKLNNSKTEKEETADVSLTNVLNVDKTTDQNRFLLDDIHEKPPELFETTDKEKDGIKTVLNVQNEITDSESSKLTNIESKKQDVIEIQEEEITMSKDHSPFISIAAQIDPALEQPLNLDEIQNPFMTKSKVLVTPPASPKIVSKGYNFNFDEIDDPFATKTKIRMSPTPETPSKEINDIRFEDMAPPPQKDSIKNRRKSQPEKKKPAMPKKKSNSSFSGPVKSPIQAKQKLPEEIVVNLPVADNEPNRQETPGCKSVVELTMPNKACEISMDIEHVLEKSIEVKPIESTKVPKEQISIDDRDVDTASEAKVTEDNKSVINSFSAGLDETKVTSSSEQSAYYSVGTSSGESNVNRNVFNIPEIDDMNFNPFTTKSKMCASPPPSLDLKDSKIESFSPNNLYTTSTEVETVALGDFDPPVNDSGKHVSPQSSLEAENKIGSLCTNSHKLTSAKFKTPDFGDFETKISEALFDKESANVSNITCSSKATDDKDITVREIHTEDEDTAEGPFLEADDEIDKISDFDGEDVDMMQFSELPPPTSEENAGPGEMFIDAEAFEFLLNQNQSNVVSDSGKESLFLKFDPLFAKRVSTDGVLAALNRVQKRQSTPKKMSAAAKLDTTIEKAVAGPSTLNVTHEVEHNVTAEESTEDFNVTVSKPMMVVTPAVNPIVTPRNKTTTPTSSNRRSITFTSPAIAVIDRLLSLSANNSLVGHDTTITHMSREQNEADLALTQLRELLAEKEISVYNLRSESKELKDRLSSLESQMRILESESEQRLKKVNELSEKLTEKTKINKSMAAVVEEYERTIASLIDETAQDKKRHNEERVKLTKERDEQTAHLASMEVSFSDLHSKYVKSKQIILTCKANEDACKKSIKEFEESLTKMQSNYELLKQHATSKLNHANQELEKMNRAHEAEVLKLNAMIKRKDLHITSLEETLAQKTKANEELTAICDELINKVG